MKVYSFENLVVWKEARTLKLEIYKLTQQFPQDELFALIAQIRRAVVSISANIAEGSGRTTINDQKQFYKISYSSCLEVLDHLITAYDLDYINEETYLKTREQINKVTYLLNKLFNSL